MFKKAVKHESKLRLAIAGPSGSGKTYSALAIGTALGKTAVVDTEHGSAAKYADRFPFDVLEMDAPFHPDRFVEAINAASRAGYEVLIIDSLSHAWNGAGGLLEIVDQIARRMKTSNSFAAWKDATPIQNAMIEAIVGARIHIIATMRSKQEYVLEQVERNGRTISQPKKVGMAPVQRDSMEYEFDVYLDMTIDNDAIVQKTRCPEIAGAVFNKPGAALAATLREWLSGEPVPVKQTAPKVVQPVNGNGRPPAPEPMPEPDNELDAVLGTTPPAQPMTNGKKPSVKPDQQKPSESQMRQFHSLGEQVYGPDWPEKRHALVHHVTDGRSESSKHLTTSEWQRLMDGMNKRLQAEPA